MEQTVSVFCHHVSLSVPDSFLNQNNVISILAAIGTTNQHRQHCADVVPIWDSICTMNCGWFYSGDATLVRRFVCPYFKDSRCLIG